MIISFIIQINVVLVLQQFHSLRNLIRWPQGLKVKLMELLTTYYTILYFHKSTPSWLFLLKNKILEKMLFENFGKFKIK